MNSIPQVQIEATQLDRLAAQRELYSRAKRVQAWQLILSVPCVIAWSFVVMAFPALRSYAALWAIGVTLLDLVALDRWQKSLKERAARIQEQFDCDVLQLAWPDLKGPRPDAEQVAEESSSYRRTDPQFTTIRDWYAPAVGRLPIHLGRLVCQRSSCWWDAKLRRRYSVSVLIALGLFSTLIVAVSLHESASLENFVLTGITPLMPAITLAIKQFSEHNAAAARADRLRDTSQKFWREALYEHLAVEEVSSRSRQLQDEIFEHRRQSPLIFDWIYQRLRNKHEELMNKGAEALVKEAEDFRGRLTQAGGLMSSS